MTQCDQILSHLKRKGKINPMRALTEYGIYRLAARINDLRNQGHGIETYMIERNDKRFAEYHYQARVKNGTK